MPVHGGRSLLECDVREDSVGRNDGEWMLSHTVGDDTGDNISEKNRTYNELTVIYWAWKNQDKFGNPEYVGFAHYRRHFLFRDWKETQRDHWVVDYPYMDSRYLADLHDEKENVDAYLERYACLYAKATPDMTVYEQYEICKNHHAEDLDFVLMTIREHFPHLYASAKKYVYGYSHAFCNMFVMRKDLFDEYCTFLFDLIRRYNVHRNTEYFSADECRFYISERITGIFIQHLIDRGEACCPLNITCLENTKPKTIVKPAFRKNNIPLVFAVDDACALYLSVTLCSILQHAKECNNYDICILYEALSSNSRKTLERMFRGRPNFSLRFIDMRPFLAEVDRDAFYIQIHVSQATYYRFFVEKIFAQYDKILYLDVDLVTEEDVADLYTQDLGDNWIGACIDIRASIAVKANMNEKGVAWADYVRTTLGLADPYGYFQAGVLLFNIRNMAENHVMEKLFSSLVAIGHPILSDQDVLNAVCQGHCSYLPAQWNVQWQILFEFPDYLKNLRQDYGEAYRKALGGAAIIHYASSVKPWNHPSYPLADIWWKYAKESPWFVQLVSDALGHRSAGGNQLPPVSLPLWQKVLVSVERDGFLATGKKIFHRLCHLNG